jgi:hypothetical protein
MDLGEAAEHAIEQRGGEASQQAVAHAGAAPRVDRVEPLAPTGDQRRDQLRRVL